MPDGLEGKDVPDGNKVPEGYGPFIEIDGSRFLGYGTAEYTN